MVSRLGGDSIGVCEKTIRKNVWLILNGYVDTAVWDCQQKSTVCGNENTEITITITLLEF
jgi:hypothetical protein